MNRISIRRVRPGDVPVIAALLEQLARRYITAEFTRSAEENFLKSNDEASIRAFIASGFEYWVAERCDAIIGFVGVRDHSHLYHLFVAEAEQNRGVARALWQVAERACRLAGNPGRFTVNSSNNAVGVYESFGFVRAGQTQDSGGVLFNPMVFQDAG
jgi:ribosomal protein S18 acetylase RimI-like enzyme